MQLSKHDTIVTGHLPTCLLKVFLLALILAGISSTALAVLGGLESDLPTTSKALGAEVKVQLKVTPRYRIHIFQPASKNFTVRQYAVPDGHVFGVAWEGSVKPNLAQLLGPYYQQYLDAVQAAGQARGIRGVDQPDFVLRVSGHMRHYYGVAWVPSLLPPEVNTGEIK